MSVLAAVPVLVKLINLGLKAHKSWSEDGLTVDDWATLTGALELGAGAAGLRKTPETAVAVKASALMVWAFGRALQSQLDAPSSAFAAGVMDRVLRKTSRDEREREKELLERIQWALGSGGIAPGTESVLSWPLYKALWQASTDKSLGDTRAPLVETATRAAFEREFLVAWRQGLQDASGVRDWLDSAPDLRRMELQELLMADLASWGDRHVFGNRPRAGWRDEGVPFLPLDEMYVEPIAKISRENGKDEESGPALSMIRTALKRHGVVAVRAHFGHGKSLTARRLARDLAHEWRQGDQPSAERVMPIFIRCVEDLTSDRSELERTVRRALRRQLRDMGVQDLDEDHPALAPPESGRRVLFILDGLDEVALGNRELDALFERLEARVTDRQRFLILSRPGALPDRRNDKPLHILEIQPFDEAQVELWLSLWCQAVRRETMPITRDDIAKRKLNELSVTPILLFMIALSWDDKATQGGGQAALYESFFWHVARGKHKSDRDHHSTVFDAGEKLRDRLVERGVLPKDAEAPAAMLWLLGQVAWRATCLEQRDEELDRHELETLLREVLDLRPKDDDLETIRFGLLLAIQTDLRGRDHRILFGHQSFREFLVARCWDLELRRLLVAQAKDLPALEGRLEQGSLITEVEDREWDFLHQRLCAHPGSLSRPGAHFGWSDENLQSLRSWAEHKFMEEPVGSRDEVDARQRLRHAALAIRCATRGASAFALTDARLLRSLLAWAWSDGDGGRLIAPGLQLPKVSFLSGADLMEAHLQGVKLRGAILFGADLSAANLNRADLRGALLSRADLTDAYLQGANLSGAHLEGADLSNANLSKCNLSGAYLLKADLSEANLTGANLSGASLFAADLSGANLSGTNLTDSRLFRLYFDNDTRWPDNFPATAAVKSGAIQIDTD